MIAFLDGIVAGTDENRLFLNVNGVGFSVFMPARSLAALGPSGSPAHIYTSLQVREDAMQLYGFLSREDLRIFRLLIGVSGIGPKVAMAVLSVLTSEEIHYAVLSDDVKSITAVPGLGKKTAQKLILELRDKLKLEDVIEAPGNAAAPSVPVDNSARKEAIQALSALGYSSSEALQAVNKVADSGELTVEELLKRALREMGV